MASYAGGNSSRLGQVMDKQMLRDATGGSGKLEDTIREVEFHLAKGGALSEDLVKAIQRRKDNEFMSKREQFWSNQAQDSASFGKKIMEGISPQGSANFFAIYGAQLAPGTVYTGGATKTTPGRSGRSVNGGHWSTKSSTTYTPQTMSRALYESLAQPRGEKPAASEPRTPYKPDPDLAARAQAYQRSKEFMDKSDAAGSVAFNANRTGGDLLNNVYAQGDTYQKRFSAFLANQEDKVNLQAAEIGNATRKAIYDLDPDIKLANYTNPFEDTVSGKRGDQTLFDYLRKQVTA